jgi:DNA-binding Xre family transcriptional regulator
MIEERLKAYIEVHCISVRGLIDKAGLGRSFTKFLDGGKLKNDDFLAICSVLPVKPEDILNG